MKDKRRETSWNCRGHKQRYLSGQLISHVIPREKRLSRYPLYCDSKRGEKRQICQKDCGKREGGGENRVRVRKGEKRQRLVGAAESSRELAEWRKL